jgi:hypothetical protein
MPASSSGRIAAVSSGWDAEQRAVGWDHSLPFGQSCRSTAWFRPAEPVDFQPPMSLTAGGRPNVAVEHRRRSDYDRP